MNRHIRRDAAGFSFVELLVTVIIAAIAFAALVPMFVSASKKNSSDNLRMQSTQVAQSKIEQIRDLPYSKVSTDAASAEGNVLNTPSWDGYAEKTINSDGTTTWQGQQVVLNTGSGTRIISCSYVVTPYTNYKVVTVTTTWTAPPRPVYQTRMSTIVYKQYAGPDVQELTLTPGINEQGIVGDSSLTQITFQAYVDKSLGILPAKVTFSITGPVVITKTVPVTNTTVGSADGWTDGQGNFFWTWDCSAAVNGSYVVTAQAFNSSNYPGRSMQQSPIINHVTGNVVDPVDTVTVAAGDHTVTVNWVASTEPTKSTYKIYRSTSASGPWDSTTLLATIAATSTTYTDSTAVNGSSYYYAVQTVTSDGKTSSCTVSGVAQPVASSDVTAPTAPTSLTATPSGPTVNLGWTASTDPGSPSTGVAYYEVQRSATSAFSTVTTNTTLTTSYTDAAAGYTTTWYYRVRAVDGAGNQGPFASVGPVTTPGSTVPRRSLTISVKTGNNACNVWVFYASTGQPFSSQYFNADGTTRGTSPGVGYAIAKNGSRVFTNMPDGTYTVYSNSGAFSTITNKTWGFTLTSATTTLSNVTP